MPEWTRPIDIRVHPRLRIESGEGLYKSVCYDPETRDRYFVKRYRKEVEHRAAREELGLVLCSAYGALTPGHLLIYDTVSPVLLQRFIPYQTRIGDLYRLAIDPVTSKAPNEQLRASLLAGLSTSQVTELMICWICDYLTYNWDPHPDNFLLDSPAGSVLVGVDKGLTGNFIDHPHLKLDCPVRQGDLVHYVGRETKPNNHIWGHVYEPVFTNIYRKVYTPDIARVSSVLTRIESLDHEYDRPVKAVLGPAGLEAFTRRRENLREALGRLFKVLDLEYA